jgi:hypothetical protein
MNRFRFVRYFWLVMFGLGGLLIGAALLSFANGRQALAEDDCADQPVTVAAAAQPAAQTGNACLDCHTDEARLKELAVEVVTETVSEGPG